MIRKGFFKHPNRKTREVAKAFKAMGTSTKGKTGVIAARARAMKEIERVLITDGLCYVNFLSVDKPQKDKFCKPFLGSTGFSYYEDNEADTYFRSFEIIHKEKRMLERKTDGKLLKQAYIDYIAQKLQCALNRSRRTKSFSFQLLFSH